MKRSMPAVMFIRVMAFISWSSTTAIPYGVRRHSTIVFIIRDENRDKNIWSATIFSLFSHSHSLPLLALLVLFIYFYSFYVYVRRQLWFDVLLRWIFFLLRLRFVIISKHASSFVIVRRKSSETSLLAARLSTCSLGRISLLRLLGFYWKGYARAKTRSMQLTIDARIS